MSIRDEYLHMIFTTALEGGIGYWSTCDEYHWANGETDDLQGFYADIIEIGDGDIDVPHRIDRKVIVKGYRLATTTNWQSRLAWSCERPPLVFEDLDSWDFDAGDADMIVQLGLFEDVVYG